MTQQDKVILTGSNAIMDTVVTEVCEDAGVSLI
jgi:hypothetical protein